MPQPVLADGELRLTYQHLATGNSLEIIPETSMDLIQWTPNHNFTTTVIGSIANTTVAVPLSPPANRLCLRLKITRQPPGK